MPAMVGERLLDLWMTPIGFAKAAAESGKTRVAIEGTSLTVTTEAAGATAKAILNARDEPERIEARLGDERDRILHTGIRRLERRCEGGCVSAEAHRAEARRRSDPRSHRRAHQHATTRNVIMPVPANVSAAPRN